MLRLRVGLMLLAMLASVAYGEEPPPAPKTTRVNLVVQKGVEGTGTKSEPFVFDSSSICLVALPATVAAADLTSLEWDLEDGPADAIIIEQRLVAFSLTNSGLHQVSARWAGGWGKAWLRIKGPNGPPVDDDPSALIGRVTRSLTGPDAKADAAKLSAICDQIVEELAGSEIKETGDLFEAWEAAFGGQNALKGKYPDLAKLLREVLPAAGESTPISDTDRTALSQKFKQISQGAKGVANGK